MKDFIRTTISTNLGQEDLHSILSNELPDYVWRMGDSDQQGKYVSGNGLGQILLWLDDNEVDVSISLRAENIDHPNRNEWKDGLLSKLLNNIFPKIGTLGEVNEVD